MLRSILVNESIYNKPLNIAEHSRRSKRLNVKLFLAPSDIPQKVSSTYVKDNDTFTILFNYINEEKEKELFNQNDLKLFIGLQSGKPLRIELKDVLKKGINEVMLTNIIRDNLSRLIDDKIKQIHNIRERNNLQCAEELLQVNADKLSFQPA